MVLKPGTLRISYGIGTSLKTIDCGVVTSVSDDIKSNVLVTPIVTYDADNAFAFDTGSTENITFSVVRRCPNPLDPTEMDDTSIDSTKWSNRKWMLELTSVINRWQMKTDGCTLTYTPIVQTYDPTSETYTDVYQRTISANAYIKTISISYDTSSHEILRAQIIASVGSMGKVR